VIIAGEVKSIMSATVMDITSTRPEVDSLNLIEGHGIENDKFAGKDLDKTVMIVGTPTYKIAEDKNIILDIGTLGENILFDFDPHLYPCNTIFRIGDAKIQVTQACTICNHLAVYDPNLPAIIENHRGLYCKIIKSGTITAGQTIYIR